MSVRRFCSLEEYHDAMLQCYIVVNVIAQLRLEDLHVEQDLAETLGPILDPSSFMWAAEKLRQDMSVVNALRDVLARLPESLITKMRGRTT